MSVKSNIIKNRLISEAAQLVSNIPLPPENWPTLIEPSNVDPVVTPDPDPESTLVQSNASWTAPTSTVTFVLMMAEVQVSSTPPVGGYQIIKQVPGVNQSYNDLGLRDVYASFFGYFVLSDAGKYVPYIMKFVDEYGREIIVKNSTAEIIPS